MGVVLFIFNTKIINVIINSSITIDRRGFRLELQTYGASVRLRVLVMLCVQRGASRVQKV